MSWSAGTCSGGRWIVGYPEADADLVENLHAPIGSDVRRHRIAGIVSVAVRARTSFTGGWLAATGAAPDMTTTGHRHSEPCRSCDVRLTGSTPRIGALHVLPHES